jgi:hypothetical protein
VDSQFHTYSSRRCEGLRFPSVGTVKRLVFAGRPGARSTRPVSSSLITTVSALGAIMGASTRRRPRCVRVSRLLPLLSGPVSMYFCTPVRATVCDEIWCVTQADGLQRRPYSRGGHAGNINIERMLDGLLRPHVLDSSEVSPCMLAHGVCALARSQAHAAYTAPYDVRRQFCCRTTTIVDADIATVPVHLEVPVISARRRQPARRAGQGWWPSLLLTVVVFSALVPTPAVGIQDPSR